MDVVIESIGDLRIEMKVLESKSLSYIELNVHTDERGDLLPIEKFEGGLEFDPIRSFYLSNVPAGESRAGHAVDCDLFIIALKGTVLLENKIAANEAVSWELNSIEKGIIVPAYNFITLKNFSKDALIVIYASKKFKDTTYFSFDELQGK